MDTFITSDEVSSRDGDDRAILSDSRGTEANPVRSSVKTIHSRIVDTYKVGRTLGIRVVFDDNLSFFSFFYLFILFFLQGPAK